MANVISYNLADLSEAEAQEKGPVLYKAWKEFRRKKLEEQLIARQTAREAAKVEAEKAAV